MASPSGLPDRLQAHYLPERLFAVSLAVRVTAAITAHLPVSELAAALMLAEVYQGQGRLEEAIGVVHQVHEALANPLVRLSLCDLLLADRNYAGVVETAAGVANESDVEAEILHVRAAAQVALDQRTGALDSFRGALSKTAGRDPGLLLAVRYDRALAGAVRPAREVPGRPRAHLRREPQVRGRGRPAGGTEGHGMRCQSRRPPGRAVHG